MKKIFGILTVFILAISCGGDDTDEVITTNDDGGTPPAATFDRSAMLTNWADNIIIPGYVDFAAQVTALETAVIAFNEEVSSSSYQDLTSAWFSAYSTWQKVSMFEIGPAEDVSLRLNVNIYPSNIETIEGNIASGGYDLDLSSNRAAKGFPAFDYLLHGLAETEENIRAIYQGENGAQYKQYLSAIIADMKSRTQQVLVDWQGDYRDVFVTNDGSSATASTDRFVNDYIFYYEKFLRAGKMGIPGGVFSGTANANNIEARYLGNDAAREFFVIGLTAVQNFFNGRSYNGTSTGESLSSYLDELNSVTNGDSLSEIINNQFDDARTAVTSLETFEAELGKTPPTIFLEAYDEVQRAVPLLKVDMVSAMSIRIDFADADGD